MTADTILARPYRRASLAIYTTVALAAFEGTAVAAILPQVAGDLGRLDLLPWVITGYLFVAGVATVVAGAAIDAIGTRTMFRWAVILFTVAGTLAGLVSTMPMMVAVRVLHGIGGGLVIAVGISAVSLVYPSTLMGRAFAANSTVWGVMGVAAPGIAALMLSIASWRWVFLINLPLGLIALLAGWRTLPGVPGETEHTSRRRTLDVIGTLLIASFTFSLLMAVGDLDSPSLWWAAGALISVFGYLAHLTRSEQPVMRAEHVFHQPYSTLGLTVGLMILAAFSTNLYITLYVATARGAGTTLTAWSVFYFVIGWTLGANLSSRLLDRYAETSIMLLGLAFLLPGLVMVAVAVPLVLPLPFIFLGLLMAGIGIGHATNAALTLLRSVTPDATIGRAGSAHQFLRNLGFTLGSAVGGAVLLLTLGSRLGSVAEVEALLNAPGTVATARVSDAVAAGYGSVATVAAVVALISAVPMLMLRRHLWSARMNRRGTPG